MARNRVRVLTPEMARLIDPAALPVRPARAKRTPRPVEYVEPVRDVDEGRGIVRLAVPVRLTSRANTDSHAHWTVRLAANRAVDDALGTLLATIPAAVRDRLAGGCVIRLTRVAPRELDRDNLHGAMKHVRDSIARWLLDGRSGQRDEDARLDWREPTQRKDEQKYGLDVRMWASR